MIKTFIRIAAWGVVIALVVLLPVVASNLPVWTGEIIRDMNESWAGVLRIWLCPGFEPGYGSFMPWLNARLSRFEARYGGVYVQIINVSSETLKLFADGELNPPDVILFSPGMISDAFALTPLSPTGLRIDYAEVGELNGVTYASPIAAGGYAWAYNVAYLKGVPTDFRELAEIGVSSKTKDPVYYVNWPADSPFMSWSAALLSLMADRIVSYSESTLETPKAGEGIDLGLPYESATPESDPLVHTETVSCYLPEDLPLNFRKDSSVYPDFVNGNAAAIPVTQREIRRLQILSDSGRAPEYRVEAVGENFTDQLLLFGIVNYPKDDIEERQELCAKLLDFLLSEDSQRALDAIRAFPVIDTAPLYSGQIGMAQLEAALSGTVKVPNAFDGTFRAQAQAQADQLSR